MSAGFDGKDHLMGGQHLLPPHVHQQQQQHLTQSRSPVQHLQYTLPQGYTIQNSQSPVPSHQQQLQQQQQQQQQLYQQPNAPSHFYDYSNYSYTPSQSESLQASRQQQHATPILPSNDPMFNSAPSEPVDHMHYDPTELFEPQFMTSSRVNNHTPVNSHETQLQREQYQHQQQPTYPALQSNQFQQLPQSSLYRTLSPAEFASNSQYGSYIQSQAAASSPGVVDWSNYFAQHTPALEQQQQQQQQSINPITHNHALVEPPPIASSIPRRTSATAASTIPAQRLTNFQVVIPVRQPTTQQTENSWYQNNDLLYTNPGYDGGGEMSFQSPSSVVPNAEITTVDYSTLPPTIPTATNHNRNPDASSPQSVASPPTNINGTAPGKPIEVKLSDKPNDIKKRVQAHIENEDLTLKQVVRAIWKEMEPYNSDPKKEAIDPLKDEQDDERKAIILKTIIDDADRELTVAMTEITIVTGRIRSWLVNAWRKDPNHIIVKYALKTIARMTHNVNQLADIKLDKVLALITKKTENGEIRKLCELIVSRAQARTDKAKAAEKREKEPAPAANGQPTDTGLKRKSADGADREASSVKKVAPTPAASEKNKGSAQTVITAATKPPAKTVSDAAKSKNAAPTVSKSVSGPGSFFSNIGKAATKASAPPAPKQGTAGTFSSIFDQLREREAQQEFAKKNVGRSEAETAAVVKKKKKTVKWKTDDALVEVQIFEVLEPEGDYYGGGTGSGTNARQVDVSEGNAWKNRNLIEDDENEVEWYPPLPILVPPTTDMGGNGFKRSGDVRPESTEAKIQTEREMKVLSVHYFSMNDIPFSPNEPGPNSDGEYQETSYIPFQSDYKRGFKDMDRKPTSQPSPVTQTVPLPSVDISKILSTFQPQQPIVPVAQPVAPAPGRTDIASVLARLASISKQQTQSISPAQQQPMQQQQESSYQPPEPTYQPSHHVSQLAPAIEPAPAASDMTPYSADAVQSLLAQLSTSAVPNTVPAPVMPAFPIPPLPQASMPQINPAAAAALFFQAMASGGMPPIPGAQLGAVSDFAQMMAALGSIPPPVPPVDQAPPITDNSWYYNNTPNADQNQWANNNISSNTNNNNTAVNGQKKDETFDNNANNGNNQQGGWGKNKNKKNKNKHYQEAHPYKNNNQNNAGSGKRIVCSFYAAGNCKKGPECGFIHEGEQQNQKKAGGVGGGFKAGKKFKKRGGFGGHAGGSGSAADSAVGEDNWSGEMEY